jgi:serine/threonine protein kinase/tetratricopeptide (TPR) repeat protein
MTNPGTGPLGIGDSFGRYHVIRLLGMGGMGAVYHAWDEILSISVALKVIRPDAITDPAAVALLNRRFKRELLLARKVTHDNVVRIHDLGELADIKYITMSYIEGEDLATRLKREGKLPVATALVIARQVAAGLAAAHRAGVVHRDLKPANIMVETDLHSSIMDFGIARSADAVAPPPTVDLEAAARLMAAAGDPPESTTADASPQGDEGATRVAASSPARTAPGAVGPGDEETSTPATGPATETGVTMSVKTARRMTIAANRQAAMLSMVQGSVMGTMGYMAPEQATGEAVDQRADVYAFGMILSEMLIGRRPAPQGFTPYEALMHRCQTDPTSLREVEPSIPEAIDAIVLRCLQLEADKRFTSAEEVVAELDRLDENGVPRPVARRLTPRMIAAAAVLVTALLGATYWTARTRPAPAAHEPMSVLIGDFENTTGDAALDATVEQSLGIALEGAAFITNFPRATANAIAAELKAAQGIDEATARLIALREGVNVVVAGSIAPRGDGYRIAVKTIDPQGKELASFSGNASGKNDVLRVVSQLASRVRDQFGDTTSAKARQADAETFTAASLEAVGEYAMGQDLASAGKDEDAIAHYRAALEKDPQFGRAYSGWAVSANKVGRSQEAGDVYKKAFSVLDRMTEREKLRTLGAYYLQVAGSYDKAIDNYSQLVTKYPADRGGHSNLAISYFASLDFPKALAEGRAAIRIYPRNVTFHSNVALYALYASDFKAAAEEAARVIELDKSFAKGYLPLAMAAIDNGNFDAARDAYGRMAATGAVGASRAASGLADLDLYTGRYKDAERRLRTAIVDDDKNHRTEGLIAKRVALAEALLAQARPADARREAAAIEALSDGVAARVSAARILVLSGGDEQGVRRIAGELDNQLQPQKRAYAKILEGELALARRRVAEAVDGFTAARKFTDLWLARFDLGVAYVQAGAHAEAVSELELAEKRRGEAAAMFLDDWPTVHQLTTLQYWLGRAHEGLGAIAVARQNYQSFLSIRAATTDLLTSDARKRLAALPAAAAFGSSGRPR